VTSSLTQLASVNPETVTQENVPLLLVVLCEHTAPFSHLNQLPGLYWSSAEHQSTAKRLFGTLAKESGAETHTQECGTETRTQESGVATFTQESGAATLTPESGSGTLTPDSGTVSQLLGCRLVEMLEIVTPRLDNWHQYPATCSAASVIFTLVDPQLAGEYFGRLFPYILRWLDTWIKEPRLLAVRTLNILLERIPTPTFTKFGRDKVLYDALLPLLQGEDLQLLQETQAPLLRLLEICSLDSRMNPAKPNQVDAFVGKLFSSIMMDSALAKKVVKVDMLLHAWSLLGHGALRWVSKLAKLIENELEVPGEHSVSLLCLWDLVCVHHPEAATRDAKTILAALVKLCWRWSNGQTPETVDRQSIVTALTSQIALDPTTFIKLTKGILVLRTNSEFVEIMAQLLELATQQQQSQVPEIEP